jgi:hypothetical protein
VIEALAEVLRERGKLDLSKCFIDCTFVAAKKGLNVGKTQRGKGMKRMSVAEGAGLTVSGHAPSASPHEEVQHCRHNRVCRLEQFPFVNGDPHKKL